MDQNEKEAKALRARKRIIESKLNDPRQHKGWNPAYDHFIFTDGTTVSREYLEDHGLINHIPKEHRFKRNMDR